MQARSICRKNHFSVDLTDVGPEGEYFIDPTYIELRRLNEDVEDLRSA